MVVLYRLDSMLAVVERVLLVLLLSGLIGLGFLQMLLRNFFASGLFWADEVLRHVVVWLGMLGASPGHTGAKHLNFDVLARWLPPWCRLWCTLLINLIAVLVCMLLYAAAWRFLQDERAAGTRLALGVATWVVQYIFPWAF